MVPKASISLLVAVAATGVAVTPATAAPSVRGTVLSVDRAHRSLRVVTPRHAVRSYTLSRPAQGSRLRARARVSLRVSGRRVTALRLLGQARTIRFYGRVVRDAGNGVVLRLGDGRSYTVLAHAPRSRRATAARVVAVTLAGLAPGQAVLVTIRDVGNGDEAVSIDLVAPGGGGDVVTGGDDGGSLDDDGGNDYEADGSVIALDAQRGSLTVATDAGSLTFAADPQLLADVAVGDAVAVSYAKDPSGALIADDVADSGAADGNPAGDPSSGVKDGGDVHNTAGSGEPAHLPAGGR